MDFVTGVGVEDTPLHAGHGLRLHKRLIARLDYRVIHASMKACACCATIASP